MAIFCHTARAKANLILINGRLGKKFLSYGDLKKTESRREKREKKKRREEWLFVAGAVFGDVRLSLFLAGAIWELKAYRSLIVFSSPGLHRSLCRMSDAFLIASCCTILSAKLCAAKRTLHALCCHAGSPYFHCVFQVDGVSCLASLMHFADTRQRHGKRYKNMMTVLLYL